MNRLLLSLVLFEAGCVSLKSVSIQSVSTEPFTAGERNSVYARSLTAFQTRGMLISLSEPVGGVLRSELQRSWIQCANALADDFGNRGCWSTEQTQLTIGSDGNAFLRIDRVVTGTTQGYESPVSPDMRLQFQQECTAMLGFIVGKVPEPPAPPPGAGLLPLTGGGSR